MCCYWQAMLFPQFPHMRRHLERIEKLYDLFCEPAPKPFSFNYMLSLGPRPKTNPSVDRFQYRTRGRKGLVDIVHIPKDLLYLPDRFPARYTGSDIHTG